MLDPERWRQHLESELLPFWLHPDAVGDPVGLFPSIRCNDGTLVDLKAPCVEVTSMKVLSPGNHLTRAISEQSFAYGTAFHMTGDMRYLGLARAGVDQILGPGFDDESGGNFVYFSETSGTWGPAAGAINLPSQARAMLGPAFYYYLTRDPALLEAITGVRQTIVAQYRQADGSYSWLRRDFDGFQGNTGRIDGYLEQIASLYLPMIPLLPKAEADLWRAELGNLVDQLRGRFYSGRHNVFVVDRGQQTGAGLTPPPVDYGRSARSFRLMLAAAALLGDDELDTFARENGRKLLGTSLQMRQGAWSEIASAGKKGAKRRTSRVYSEQNELTAMLALADPKLANALQRTYAFWFDRFVDPVSGGIYPVILGKRRKISMARPKHTASNAGASNFEHALISYLASAALGDGEAVLYFAGATPGDAADQPFLFSADVTGIEALGNTGVRKVSFTNVRAADPG